MAVAEKGRAFEEWLQRRDRVTHDRYRAQRVAEAVRVAKEFRTGDGQSDWGMISRITNFKKMFWKEVKRVRHGDQAIDERVKDINGQILRDGVKVKRRWAGYF